MERVFSEKEIHITIDEEGFHRYQIKSEGEVHIVMEIAPNINTEIYMEYIGAEVNVVFEMLVKEDSHIHILHQNHMLNHFNFEESTYLYRNSYVHTAHIDIHKTVSKYNNCYYLQDVGAQIDITTVMIASAKKQSNMKCVHRKEYTISHLSNYALVQDNGNYYMEACGQIGKGSYGSETHQATRVLTLSQTQKSEVIPVLLIDENDVKASHATTIGQPDENQLYYLESRGLSRNRALALLTIGYMMPIIKVLSNLQIQETLQAEISKEVGLYD